LSGASCSVIGHVQASLLLIELRQCSEPESSDEFYQFGLHDFMWEGEKRQEMDKFATSG
jgi:hypothetical protein